MNKTISPDTSAVILVNYNNARDTLECLRSLGELARPARHVVIVDNHSKDNSVQELRDYLSQLKVACILNEDEDCGAISAPCILLLCKHNHGFSGGNNAALRLLMQKTDCNAFWMLNNDTIVDPNALEHLCARLNEAAEAGACGSTMVFQKRDDTVQCAAGSSLRKYLGTTRFVCGGASMADVEKMSTAAVEKELDEILGASLFVRRAAVEQCGLMDKRYFLYREDSEWCTRFRKFGFTLAWARNSIVRHKEGGTTGASSANNICRGSTKSLFIDCLEIRNRFFFLRTHFPHCLPTAFVSMLAVCFNRLRRGQGTRIPRLFAAALEGICGNMDHRKYARLHK